MNNMNNMGVSINLGRACNFRCKYCFEVKDGSVDLNNIVDDKVIDRTIELLHKMQPHYDILHIEFWGGEPLMYFDTVYKLYKEFCEYDNVEFFMYTNGSLVEKYKDQLLEMKNKINRRLQVQVSYDFHDEKTNQRIQLNKCFDDNDFNFGIKSTCTINDLENNIFNQYVAYDKLNQSLKHKVVFACTPDTLNNGNIDYDKMNTQFIKLINYFIKNKQGQKTGFVWFDSKDKANCHGGDNYLVENDMFSANNQCLVCDSVFCYRCNAINSCGDKDKWDSSNQDAVCKLYKKISNYILAYNKLIEQKEE